MADTEKKDRPSRDLYIPETMKIAALLAELMPDTAPAPEPMLHEPIAVAVDEPAVELPPPLAPVPTPPPLQRLSKSNDPWLTAMAAPADHQPEPIGPMNGTAVWPEAPPILTPSTSPPEPAPPPFPETLTPAAAAGSFLGDSNWKNDPEFGKAAPAGDVPPPPIPDPDCIPLGELTTAAYFSLVNWRNEPDRGRHPRRSDFGLDDASLAMAKSIPFYVVGQPRVPDKNTVAAVLSGVAWE